MFQIGSILVDGEQASNRLVRRGINSRAFVFDFSLARRPTSGVVSGYFRGTDLEPSGTSTHTSHSPPTGPWIAPVLAFLMNEIGAI